MREAHCMFHFSHIIETFMHPVQGTILLTVVVIGATVLTLCIAAGMIYICCYYNIRSSYPRGIIHESRIPHSSKV